MPTPEQFARGGIIREPEGPRRLWRYPASQLTYPRVPGSAGHRRVPQPHTRGRAPVGGHVGARVRVPAPARIQPHMVPRHPLKREP